MRVEYKKKTLNSAKTSYRIFILSPGGNGIVSDSLKIDHWKAISKNVSCYRTIGLVEKAG